MTDKPTPKHHRKHKDLIIDWANGAKIQEKLYNDVSETYVWVDQELPRWIPEYEYRIKPREFKEGAWYPIQYTPDQGDRDGKRLLARYVNGLFHYSESPRRHGGSSASTIYWIGEELEINWPDEKKERV